MSDDTAFEKLTNCIETTIADEIPMPKADLVRTHILVYAPSTEKRIMVLPYEYYVWAKSNPDSAWIDPLREDSSLYTKYIATCRVCFHKIGAAVNLRAALEKAFDETTKALVKEAFRSCAFHARRKDPGFRNLDPSLKELLASYGNRRASFLDPFPYAASLEQKGETVTEDVLLRIVADAISEFYLEFSTVDFR